MRTNIVLQMLLLTALLCGAADAQATYDCSYGQNGGCISTLNILTVENFTGNLGSSYEYQYNHACECGFLDQSSGPHGPHSHRGSDGRQRS